MRLHPRAKPYLTASAVAAAACVAATLTLRGLHLALAFDAQFSAIFAQIAAAPMRPPLLLALALALAAAATTARLGRGWQIALAVVGGLLLWLLCLALTRVNGVYFGDVLRTLIPLLAGGGL